MKNLTLFTLLLSLFACKHKEESIYAGCCGTEPTTSSVLVQVFDTSGGMITYPFIEANIFVPNVFLPNDDSFYPDNYFTVFGGKGVDGVLSMIVTDENGETQYSKSNLPVNVPMTGWTGKKNDGTYYYGPFNYEVKILYVDGQTKNFIGKSCAVKCGDTDFAKDRLPNCFFPKQHENGQGNPNIPYNKICF